MLNRVSSSSTLYPYLSGFFGENSYKPTKKAAADSWEGKPICKDENDPRPNCCCDGYSIEAVLDEAHEYGLDKRREVKRLEKYPCITCSELETIADRLAVVAPEKTEEQVMAERKKELEDMSKAIDGFENCEKLNIAPGQIGVFFPCRSN